MIKIDRSTLNMEALKKLPVFVPGFYKPSRTMGQGCAGDPPGFPTYFLQPIYSPSGNNPQHGPESVIMDDEGNYRVIETADWNKGETWDTRIEKFKALMRSLYKPLPFEHPRVAAWVSSNFTHMKHCYADDAGLVTDKNDSKMFIYPVPSYKLRHFHDDPRTKERAAVEQANADIEKAASALAIFDNHKAVRHTRSTYPDVGPETIVLIQRHVTVDGTMVLNGRKATLAELVTSPEKFHTGDWKDANERMPTPTECNEVESRWRPGPHCTGWCQMCGAIEE